MSELHLINLVDHLQKQRDQLSLGSTSTTLSPLLLTPRKNEVQIDVINAKTKEIEETRKTTNVVTFSGRVWLIQHAFNQLLTSSTNESCYPYIRNYLSMKLRYIMLGKGGAESNNPLEPVTALATDYKLYTPLPITSDSTNPVVGQNQNVYWRDTSGYWGTANAYYHFHVINLKVYEPDPGISSEDISRMRNITYDDNTKIDQYLVCRIEANILEGEYNYDPDNQSNEYADLNEIGLFATVEASGNSISGSGVRAVLFARSTFSTIRKDVNRSLKITWKFYF